MATYVPVGGSSAIISQISGTPVSNVLSGAGSLPASPATPIQHRLMLKTHAIDTWSLREQLGLASAVLRSGDQNWVSVSRQMKPFAEDGRPNDWFSQKNCALQYKLLLEKVGQHKAYAVHDSLGIFLSIFMVFILRPICMTIGTRDSQKKARCWNG